MIGTAQGAQERSRASRGWLGALALGAVLAFGAAPALAGDGSVAEASDMGKKKDVVLEKVSTPVDDKAKKDDALDKDALSDKAAVLLHGKSDKDEDWDKRTESQSKAGLDDIKTPEIKTGDERKKP